MSKLQTMVDAARVRMDAIQNYLYWAATQQPGAVLSEGAFYAGGPVCLVATLPDGTRKSTIKARYRAEKYWTA